MKKIKVMCLMAVAVLALSGCQKDDLVIFNDAPKVDAGPDQVHENVISSFVLEGSATDHDGKVVAFQWVQVDGPNKPGIQFPGTPRATVTGLAVGTYKFQLHATDEDGATGVDSVSITVKKVERDPVTATLKPLAKGDIQLLMYPGWNQNDNGLDIPLAAWTDGGSDLIVRNVLKFDMSSIPSDAVISSAKLYLYSYPANLTNGNKVDANFGTDNSFLVQRITNDWDPATIGWNNKPAVTDVDQVIVPHTDQSKLNLELDVKNLVQSMVTKNYGFHMKLVNEVSYTSRIFVSSHNPTYSNLAPKLVVTYK